MIKPRAIAMLFLLLMVFASIELISCKPEGDNSMLNISSVEVQKAHVGDIDMAYKVLGQGQPLIMIIGSSSTMDLWPPEVLSSLSSHFKVIIFDNRGMGYTTAQPGNFTIEQFANDTSGLMDALGIKNASILGWSMGSFIAQDLALNHPDKVDSLVLYASDCGGSHAVPPSPEVIEELTNTSGSPEERGMRLFGLLFPEEWMRVHPEFYKQFPIPNEISSPENIARQNDAVRYWAGTYDMLPGIVSPTLLIVGTEDRIAPPENSLIMAERIPGSWLVRFRGAGHGLMYQYPDEFSRIVTDFIEIGHEI
ncbi:MAG TPA: alpha/beta hydrolase [Methanotrichaceae archaeon]|nr:alpha/beta hydrolase [Methanotrichaceae archaeon]